MDSALLLGSQGAPAACGRRGLHRRPCHKVFTSSRGLHCLQGLRANHGGWTRLQHDGGLPRGSVHVRAAEAALPVPENPSPENPDAQEDKDQQKLKIAGLGASFFFSTFIYTILQNLKDSIIVTSVGAEALPFLEAYGVLPMSLMFFVLYNKLNQRLPEKWVYQAALTPFLAFYALFATVLWPLADKLHPTHLLVGMKEALPAGLAGLAGMIVHWSFSLFFIMGELWGGVAISLLFWGLADEVCTIGEAESVYPMLGIIANVGLVLAGAWIKTVNKCGPMLAQVGLEPLQALLGTVLVMSMGLFVVKGFVQDKFVKPDPAAPVKRMRGKKEKKKSKSIGESLAVLKNSPKVGNLAILVISYFISQKLFDFAWKAQLRVTYPCAMEYQKVLADVAQWTGVTTIALMCTSKWVFRMGGWSAAALATPVTVLVSGAIFFASAIAMQGGASMLGPEAVAALLAVGGVAGAVGRVASRAPKYSLFDPAKEMVYITMEKEEKTEGKAAVDLLGSYFGKSGASWIMQILVLTMGSLTHAMPVMALVHMVVGVAWTRSTFSLAKLMEQANKEQAIKDAAEKLAAEKLAAEKLAAEESGPQGPSSSGPSGGPSSGPSNGNGNGNGNGGVHVVIAATSVSSSNGNGNGHAPLNVPLGLSGTVDATTVTFRQPA